jgi:hypothetical protein
MPTDWKAIGDALHAFLEGESAITDLIETYQTKPAIFVGLAGSGANAPYISLHYIGISPDDTHDSRGEKAVYQVSVFAYKLSEAIDILSQVNNKLHWQTVTGITGYASLSAYRCSAAQELSLEDDEELFGMAADYEIMVQEV